MKLSEVLTGPETWCQIHFKEAGRYCLLGALIEMFPDHEVRAVERERLLRIIQDIHDPREFSPMRWNDGRARTWDEVAAVVDAYDRDRLLNP